MREQIARHLNIEVNQVSVKATTEEGLGFTGREEGVSAYASVLIQSKS
jgi:2-C-methyl-D-erythritol 2,4-cyclodiphosphate synthase